MSDSHYFIGIPVSETSEKLLLSWQSELKNKLPYKQWTQNSDFHITLKFLGAVNQEKLTNLLFKLKAIERIPAFALEIKGVNYFGNANSPRVLYAEVPKTRALAELVETIATAAEDAGFEREKREFRAHITLAKKWKDPLQKIRVNEMVRNYQIEKPAFDVKEINVYQIYPSKNPKYEVIKSYKLMGR
ncbi:RNA 2',3'-cyclic phosphodiesterase [Virgibacillus flavescens]|uniref:RNA 2',3'-cyclic phosphodiesterase n=1 Tax=Virgibacillus flavescens TaxID=1611422 RepID=UPI003D3375A5